MSLEQTRVLLLYADKYYLIKQIYPFGLDVIANHLRGLGAAVEIGYPFLPDPDPAANLPDILREFRPDFIGIGLRNLDTCMACEEYGDHSGPGFRTFYFVPHVKKMIQGLKELAPEVPLIIGGGGFTVAPEPLLDELGLDFGAVGEGEAVMERFIRAWPNPEELAQIPGLVFRRGSEIVSNPREPYRFAPGRGPIRRDPGFERAFETAGLPVQVKRGCDRTCSYCVEPLIEGNNCFFRDPFDIVQEIQALAEEHPHCRKIFFVDTEYNVPDQRPGAELASLLIQSGLSERFSFASQFLPAPFDRDLASILAQAGFSVVLTCDSFSDQVLKANHVAHSRQDVIRAIELCLEFNIQTTVDLIFGLPGETFETLEQTIRDLGRFPPGPNLSYEYAVGGRIYPGTRLEKFVRTRADKSHIHGRPNKHGLAPWFYCSPLDPAGLYDYLCSRLPFSLKFDNRYDQEKIDALAAARLIDQGKAELAEKRFMKAGLAAKESVFAYLFRKLAESGAAEPARRICLALLAETNAHGGEDKHPGLAGLARFHLGLLPPKVKGASGGRGE